MIFKHPLLYKDIDEMTNSEWLNHRENLRLKHRAKGRSLAPNPTCDTCDLENDYLCFECECYLIDNWEK
jgi:hypothetical protein